MSLVHSLNPAVLHPDAAILLLTLGLALIYIELNRPGIILPGAIGLFATLIAIAALASLQQSPAAAALLFSSSALLLLGLRRQTSLPLAIAATIGIVSGLILSVPHPRNPPLHLTIAALCGLTLGVGTSVLTRIARRARTNKGLD